MTTVDSGPVRPGSELPELTSVVLLALDDTGTSYQILVRSSFAQYLARFLLDAAIEHTDA
jgi:sarcosine oxidase, subunit gamma